MQRELKFRAWDGKRMGQVLALSINDDGAFGAQVDFDSGESEPIFGPAVRFVQYTGYADKNGKEIYEGDIVNCCRYNTDDEYMVVIEDIRYLPNEMFGSCLNWREVIGNIYENPELLKQS